MNTEPDGTKPASPILPGMIAVSVAVVTLLVFGLVSVAKRDKPSNQVISGDLKVTYMLITSKTANSERASGGTVDASRVEYFPAYVLVTTNRNITKLWPIERLKQFEVSVVESP